MEDVAESNAIGIGRRVVNVQKPDRQQGVNLSFLHRRCYALLLTVMLYYDSTSFEFNAMIQLEWKFIWLKSEW